MRSARVMYMFYILSYCSVAGRAGSRLGSRTTAANACELPWLQWLWPQLIDPAAPLLLRRRIASDFHSASPHLLSLSGCVVAVTYDITTSSLTEPLSSHLYISKLPSV